MFVFLFLTQTTTQCRSLLSAVFLFQPEHRHCVIDRDIFTNCQSNVSFIWLRIYSGIIFNLFDPFKIDPTLFKIINIG